MKNLKLLFSSWIFIELRMLWCLALEYKTFRCPNGTYISDQLVCNGENDCIKSNDLKHIYLGQEGDDEFYCKHWLYKTQISCGAGKVICSTDLFTFNPKCKNVTVLCNTLQDCFLGSDESFCGDEINVKNCSLDGGKYLCDDGLRCLDFQYTCDGFCNCFDCSDEKSGCSIDGYAYASSTSHTAYCFKTPDGPSCCSEYDSLCQRCASSENVCDQKCIKFIDQIGCFCDENYVAVRGDDKNTKCITSDDGARKSVLLYSTNRKLRGLNIFTNIHFILKESFCSNTAFTAAHDHVYYAVYEHTNCNTDKNYLENNPVRIFKMSMNSNETIEIIKLDETVTSLAVDWITDNVYYTTRSYLSVCSNNGKICKQLKSKDGCSYVNLAPKFGLMFWLSCEKKLGYYSSSMASKWLMKSSMDGSDEKFLVSLSSTYDQLMTVDESTKVIYLYNGLYQQVRSITFDGNELEVRLLGTPAYSGTFFQSEFYFVNSMRNGIFSADKNIKNIVQRISRENLDSFDEVNHLYAYNPFLQRTKISNPCPASCTGLCLLRPSSSEGVLNYTCYKGSFWTTDFILIFLPILFSSILIYVFVKLYLKGYIRNWCKIGRNRSPDDSIPTIHL